ncbi:hypothetical protein FRC08_011920, partial [Ceratobasidium sp. 394]
MQMCKVEVTVKGQKSWFTEQEVAWLLAHYHEYEALPAGKKMDENAARFHFYNRLEREFCQRFPYRDPAQKTSWDFKAAQRKLAMSEDDRQKLGRRMGDKFRNHRKNAARSAADAGTSVRDPLE